MSKEKEYYFSKDELKQFGNITEFQEQMGKVLEGTPMDYWMKLGEQNMKAWQDMFKPGGKNGKDD